MNGPPLRDGGVVFSDGRILAVGANRSLRNSYPDAAVHDGGNAVILPGLVNTHTHLELTSIQRGQPPARFVDWITGLMSQAGAIDAAASVQAGIEQCLRFGVTTVGDITSQPQISRPLISASPLRGISYGEVRAMAQRRNFLEPRLAAAIEAVNGNILPGISPHAPYSIEAGGYQRCLATAQKLGLPLATHLAETADEATFLADHSGPFKELWDSLNAWDDKVPRFAGSPIRFAKTIGLLDYPTLLAHVNYCDDAEMNLLAEGMASVVYCPRTHEFFGHPPHRWREMLARGINVSVGTDSCGSSPDLNLLDEIRLLHTIAPEISPLELWQLITLRGALALGSKDVGALSPGNHADLVAFAVKSDDPLREIIEQPRLPVAVWMGGKPVWAGMESVPPTG